MDTATTIDADITMINAIFTTCCNDDRHLKISLTSLLTRKILVGFTVLFLLGIETSAYGACTWKTSDIMDPRIDIGAQKSLMRQMSAGPPQSRQASAMIGAIKRGILAGILLPRRHAVSQRAARMTPPKGYWQLLSGRNSVCLHKPVGEPPMIVYRENLSKELIDLALRDAWAKCGLPTPDPPCGYVADRWAAKKECSSDQECTDKGLGDFCSEKHTCVFKDKYSWEQNQCISMAEQARENTIRQCRTQQQIDNEECTQVTIKCSLDMSYGRPDTEACVKLKSLCSYSGPEKKAQTCINNAQEKYRNNLEACKSSK